MRSSAASALERIFAETKTALPQLIPLLQDSDASVRSPGAHVLRSIALHLQEKAKRLTSPELNQAVSNLESALKILDEPKANLSQPTSANLRAYINALKAEQSNRPFIKSLLTSPYIWGNYLFFVFGLFGIRPRWLLKCTEL
ncbi:hypothetical protein NDI47_15430 [Microcoleus vaginatus GB1-A2]|nr:hypothetical protein [Microcoleus sp. FACHB-61]